MTRTVETQVSDHWLSRSYELLKPAFFRIDAERAHNAAIAGLEQISRSGQVLHRIAASTGSADSRLQVDVLGLSFTGPVGMAAGFDKDATVYPALLALGFDAVEVGTVTPHPQDGNDKPRMWRLPEEQALINRLGFPSRGRDFAKEQLDRPRRASAIVGCNVGPNRESVASGRSAEDCLSVLRNLEPWCDYFVINLSSPNTARLRDLQGKHALRQFLMDVVPDFRTCSRKPLLLKVSPDLTSDDLSDVVAVCMEMKLDGFVATNTTITRPASSIDPAYSHPGGLSGHPLRLRSLAVVAQIYKLTEGTVPIIAVGGIATGEDALDAIRAGASLVQLYTAWIYRGPRTALLIKAELSQAIDRYNVANILELRGTSAV